MTNWSALRRRADLVLAGAIAALYLFEILAGPDYAGDRAIAIPAALVFSASLAWRRRLPLASLVLAIGVIVLSNAAVPPLAEAGAFLLGLVITLYSNGAYTEGRVAIVALVLIVATIPLAAIEPGEPVTFGNLAFFVVILGGPFVAGLVIRRRRDRENALEIQAVELEYAGEEKARAAVADERARIARELHDVVAHAVSVMLLQARGAKRVVGVNDEQVREALDTIDRLGQQALGEMRRLLSLLRAHDDELELAPQPSLRRLDELVDSVRSAGLPVELQVEGEIGDLPPGVDVSAYRIVQEALTNALKHAGPARARVLIRRNVDDLDIEVIDDGDGSGAVVGSGHGLVGMRERVAIYGGRLEAGGRPQGGYALNARLPLGSVR